eukprot:jgi/Botrbrau1/1774/Bobra.0217s0029.1
MTSFHPRKLFYCNKKCLETGAHDHDRVYHDYISIIFV